MRALRLSRAPGPLEQMEVADPQPLASEVVIEIVAAGICHSDAHYRAGRGRLALPLTLGHEIAGVIVEIGDEVTNVAVGDRVAVHYLVSCGACPACIHGGEQFCDRGQMIGKDRDGGFADWIAVPARNAVAIPLPVSFEEAAVMMCSTATVYHALRLASFRAGETLAILGFGGLGISALQLAGAMGAGSIVAIDVVREKLDAAQSQGAAALDASRDDLSNEIRRITGRGGVDVVLDLAGNAATRLAALRSLAPGGRLMLVALGAEPFTLDPYADVLTQERRIIGCSDHLLNELPELMDFARRGDIELSSAITRRVPLEAEAVSAVLDDLDRGTSHLRSVAML